MDTKFEYEKLIDQQKNMIERTLAMSLDQKIDEGSSNADARRSNEVLEVEKNKVPKLTFIPDQFKNGQQTNYGHIVTLILCLFYINLIKH